MHCVNKHTIFIVNTVPFDLNDTLFTSTLTFPSILTCKYPQRSKRTLEVIQFAAIVSQPHNLNCAYIYVLHEVYFPLFFIRNVLCHVLLGVKIYSFCLNTWQFMDGDHLWQCGSNFGWVLDTLSASLSNQSAV